MKGKGSCTTKVLLVLRRIRESWDILEIFNHIIPIINCVGKEAVLISGGIASYFIKRIRVIISIQKSAVRRQFIAQFIAHVVFDLVNLKNAPAPTTIR